ncbi:MAG TPA: ABC transporter ATP-binding protein [Candidatus Angelobacter sp.]|jgi:ABC-2 type transport system ATP-binding protein|nr:ABC transporter ATP-binding protein [Candidatus Angelobacter sp.]
MHAIEIHGLSKAYAVGFWKKQLLPALRSLDLTVDSGETFGFLGPNGAGKTTTLKLLMGIIFPTSGSATILGKDCLDPEVKRKLGFLPEQPYFYDYLSAPELLDYYARLSGIPAAARKQRIDELLGRVGLSDVGAKQLRKFSKGMLQRVGIAQAIIHDPEVVFLDEPMSGLDPVGRHDVRELIQHLKDQGKTIFFSTHILSDAEALCDRVGIIHKGELRGVGVVNDFRSSVADNTEVIWLGANALAAVRDLVTDAHITGDTVRGIVQSASLDRLLEKLRAQHARLISVTPIQRTLEDYFLSKTREEEDEKEAVRS